MEKTAQIVPLIKIKKNLINSISFNKKSGINFWGTNNQINILIFNCDPTLKTHKWKGANPNLIKIE